MIPRHELSLFCLAATLAMIPALHADAIDPLPNSGFQTREGAILRGATNDHRIALVFTGHEFAEGGETILAELARHRVKAAFFLTGDFLANTNFSALVRRIGAEGHYLGPHSDRHLLYCPWEGPRSTLVTRAEFRADLEANLSKLEAFGVPRAQIRYFLPPYEHYNLDIADWSREMGLTLVNYTPGTRSNADYTSEADPKFVSSQAILESIVACEQGRADGLNGFLLLLHIGAGPGRTDKFHLRLGELLGHFEAKGYGCVGLDELLSKQSGNR